ncbi:MAG: hypothetical protein C5B59_07385 [Bacteroidetes bacterium]|nr:MAG: hypothetical protein C5B59_07385 [Bacteroidota bacterium]
MIPKIFFITETEMGSARSRKTNVSKCFLKFRRLNRMIVKEDKNSVRDVSAIASKKSPKPPPPCPEKSLNKEYKIPIPNNDNKNFVERFTIFFWGSGEITKDVKNYK